MTSEKNYYVVEMTGPRRTMWGPYTLAAARRQAGIRCAVVTGSACRDRLTLHEEELRDLIRVGSIVSADGALLTA